MRFGKSQLLDNFDEPMRLFQEVIFCDPGPESHQHKPLSEEMLEPSAFGT